jgi:LmbE family N-acetylglucosaminyl deacetylase
MVTVFAGGPASIDPLPPWDQECGVFGPGDDVVGFRRGEDEAASEVLGASSLHLAHWDLQYRNRAYGYEGTTAELTRMVALELESLVHESNIDTWVIPLGILHPDHRVTAEACTRVVVRCPRIDWFVYEDLPYATVFPEHRQIAVDALGHRGFALQLAADLESPAIDLPAKRRAVQCYRSQLPALGGGADLAVATPERIGRLVRRHA